VAPTPRGPADPGYGPVQRRRMQVLFADWNPRDAGPHDENVEVYSNCAQVELLLNGKSLGAQDRPADLAPRTWRVPYAPGTLEAVGRNHGQVAATFELRTAGKPARLVLSAEHAQVSPDWDDVDYVTAEVVDADGAVVPDADNLVRFRISGPGAIIAVDSANNASHEPFQATERHAFQGRCLAIIRATAASGRITITATSPGLAPASAEVEAVAPPDGP
jgi:beta-galactosidase